MKIILLLQKTLDMGNFDANKATLAKFGNPSALDTFVTDLRYTRSI